MASKSVTDQSFRQWIRAARTEKSIQQKEVAAHLHLSAQYIHDVEAGRRDMSSPVLVMEWARFVGVDEQEALLRAAWAHPIVSHFLMYMRDAPRISGMKDAPPEKPPFPQFDEGFPVTVNHRPNGGTDSSAD